jgi:uracil-DNA glycosylase
MIRPVVTGEPVMSPVMLIGQAPGIKEGPAGKPFAWTAGKTLFQWLADIGLDEPSVRERVYMAAVCRCFPGKATGGGDRVPSADEIKQCSRHLRAEIRLLAPRLVIPIGKLAIEQLFEIDKLTEIIGDTRIATFAGQTFDVIALPHPSGASTWHRTEPGKSLLVRALSKIAQHDAWRSLVAANGQPERRDHLAAVS